MSTTSSVAVAAAKAGSKPRQAAAAGKRAQRTATVKVRRNQLPCELQSDQETKAYWASVLQKCTKCVCLQGRWPASVRLRAAEQA